MTAHSPNYLPSVSIMAKVAQADAVIWLDAIRFSTPGWNNRNQLPDGTWLTVPFERRDHRSTISEVTIGAGSWAEDHIWALRNRYVTEENYDPGLAAILAGPVAAEGRALVDLNLAIITWMVGSLGLDLRQFRQTAYPAPGGSLSSKLVGMVKAIGGTTYLSGPSSRLDPAVFAAAGVKLAFFEFAGDNPSAIDPLFRHGELPTGSGAPRQHVRVASA